MTLGGYEDSTGNKFALDNPPKAKLNDKRTMYIEHWVVTVNHTDGTKARYRFYRKDKARQFYNLASYTMDVTSVEMYWQPDTQEPLLDEIQANPFV